MLIDTQRIEDFLKTHNCHIINKEQTLEDKVTYADFVTNRYESVFKQFQTDIEVERAYDALEDVLFIENNTRFVLHYYHRNYLHNFSFDS